MTEERPLAKIEMHGDGMFVEHNMPCAVCGKKHAVYNMNEGTFSPCWACQIKGHKLVQLKNGWFSWLLKQIGLIVVK